MNVEQATTTDASWAPSIHAASTVDNSPSHDDSHNHGDGDRDRDRDVEKASPAHAPAPAGAPQLASESFFSPRLKQQRTAYLKQMAIVTLAISVVIWCIVTIYWGSLWKEFDLSPNLHGWVVNRDAGNYIGDTIQQAILAANDGPKPHSTWSVVDPARLPNLAAIDNEIVRKESVYIILDIAANITQLLQTARANGDPSWNPANHITITYAGARNSVAIPSMVVAPATQLLQRTLVQISNTLAADFFSNPPANVAQLLARAPQTIASPLVLTPRDIRPYDTPVAIACLFVGLIYLCILAFNVTMANMGMRMSLQPFLRFRSLVAMRIFVPLVCYIFISLMISLINIPFKIPFDRVFSYGAGFMSWWCVTFVGMAVLGLVTEVFVSIGGPKPIGFMLLFFIIINVSVANLPIEVSPSFYKYGYAMPFYNIRLMYNTIIFDVGEHVMILKYMGILWAWLAVIFLTFPIWIWRERKAELKAAKQRQAAATADADAKAPAQ